MFKASSEAVLLCAPFSWSMFWTLPTMKSSYLTVWVFLLRQEEVSVALRIADELQVEGFARESFLVLEIHQAQELPKPCENWACVSPHFEALQ